MKTSKVLLLCGSLTLSLLLGNIPLRAQGAAPAQDMAHAPTAKRGITPEDYLAFQFIGDPHLSPDGKAVAFVETTIDAKKNKRVSAVWVVAADGSAAPRRLSAEGSNSNAPRWSPDGKALAILSTRAGADPNAEPPKPQIYLLSMSGGEGQALTKLKNGAESYQWSPDGTRIVVVSATGPSDAVAGAAPSAGGAASSATPSTGAASGPSSGPGAAVEHKRDVRHYTHIMDKFNDTGWFDDKRRHLWVVDVASGAAKQITEGQDWNDADPQWSPDGTRIAFVSDRTGKEYDGSDNTDVWVVPAAGGTPTKISDHASFDESPRWSADGKLLFFTGQTQRHQFPKLYVADAAGGSTSQLAIKDLDLIPTELRRAGAQTLYFVAADKGEARIYRGDPEGHSYSAVVSGPRGLRGLDVNVEAGRMVYLANDFQHLDDLYVANLDGTQEHQLTHLNTELWSKLALQPVERVEYKSSDGWPVEGFVVKPLGWQADKKYPMVLVIHGGPEGMFGVDWYQEFQVYAARGWAVFFCNPRGSTGYGEKFERGEINNWGGMDFQDIEGGVDAALKKYPWVDAEKLGVTGGSYGGYMTNWIVSHTNRYKAAVTLRSISNFISDEGTRDFPYGHEGYFKGFVFDDFQQYWDASPLKYARNVRTPTLILHSDNDFRVPIEQGEQWFRALQHYGVPSELVIFPRENHNLTRTGEPKHLVESLNWQVYWFDRYLNGNAGAKAPDAGP